MANAYKSDTKKKKDRMIEALRRTLGNVSAACKATNISRDTHYDWINKDPAYKAVVDDIEDELLDFGESALKLEMKKGNVTAIIFFLKTKGQRRGYMEKQAIEHMGEKGGPVKLDIVQRLFGDIKDKK